jgi:hypothetical protein
VTDHNEFDDADLNWMLQAERLRVAVKPPTEIANRLVDAGAFERIKLKIRITPAGRLVLAGARNSGRIPLRNTR